MERLNIVLTVVLASSGLLLSGATASASGALDSLPATGEFHWAEQHIGDRAVYGVTVVDETGNVLIPERGLWDLEWTESATMRDELGYERDVVRLLVGGFNGEDDEEWTPHASTTYSFDVSESSLVAYGYLDEFSVNWTEDTWFQSGHEQIFFVSPDDLYLTPCASRPEYAGQTIELDRGLVPFRHCSWHDYWDEAPKFTAVEEGTYGGLPGVIFRHNVGSLMQFTVVEGVPYPIQIIVERQNDRGTYHLIELQEFLQGNEPFPESSAGPRGEPFDPIMTAEWQEYPFGLLEMSYGMDRAIDDAQSDEDGQALVDWMTAHPDWYVAEVHSSQERTDEFDRTFWSINLHDAGESFSFTVDHQVPRPASGLPTADVVPDGLQGDGNEIANSTSVSISGTSANPLIPSRDQLPEKMPTAISVADRWTQFSGRDDAQSMSMRLGCVLTCADVFYELSVGHQFRDSSDGQSISDRSTLRLMHREATGGDDWFLLQSWGRTVAAPQANILKEEFTTATLDGGWSAPAEAAAFSIGSVGLLGGIAGFFWPTLRTIGALRMFTRIQNDRVLENPQRQQIMELVYADPGVHIRELRKRLAMGSGQADHHIRKMEAAGVLQVDRRGSYVCLFPKGIMDHSAMAAIPVMKADGARPIVKALQTGPQLQSDLLELTGLSKGTLSYHLKRLASVHAVKLEKNGRTNLVSLSKTGSKAASSVPAA